MFRFSNALDTILALQEAVEAARTSDYFGLSTTSRDASPAVNLFQDGDDIILMAEAPGVEKDKMEIKLKDDLITISGKRTIYYPENASVHRVERRGFKFNRTLKLPVKVNVDKVKANYENGILKVVMPRAESDKPKKININ